MTQMRIGKTPLIQSGSQSTPEQKAAFDGYIQFVKEGKLPDTTVAVFDDRGKYLKSIPASEVPVK